jgi:hypothetical protein
MNEVHITSIDKIQIQKKYKRLIDIIVYLALLAAVMLPRFLGLEFFYLQYMSFLWFLVVILIYWSYVNLASRLQYDRENISVPKKVWRWLVSRSEKECKSAEIILWWEKRRIIYNLIVGIMGIISLILFLTYMLKSGHWKPVVESVEPLALVLAFVQIINLFYTLGWIVELILWVISVRRLKIGPLLFITGTSASIIVVCYPAIFWGLVLLGWVTPPG